MPKYTITTYEDGEVKNSVTSEFVGVKSATDQAQVALAALASLKLPDGKQSEFLVSVVDELSVEIYRASLDFHAQNAREIEAAERHAFYPSNNARALDLALARRPWSEVEEALDAGENADDGPLSEAEIPPRRT